MTSQASRTLAAVDLGSNSFHLLVADVQPDGQLRVVDRLRETVRLAAGLDAKGHLDEVVVARACECLERFGQRLRGLPPGAVRAVGTNTLRQARNGGEAMAAMEGALGRDIEVISGFEEARLIYLGVAHSVADDGAPRLVMDIGGGSTEVIVGEGFRPRRMESLHIGCVSFTNRFFGDGRITRRRLEEAIVAAERQFAAVARIFADADWQRSLGASGTMKALAEVIRETGMDRAGMTAAGMRALGECLANAGTIDSLPSATGLSSRRAQVFPGGYAIAAAAFRSLGIERMETADGALREGLLYDLIGRTRQEDVRQASVEAIAERYHVDRTHASTVRDTALTLFDGLNSADATPEAAPRRLLGWAATLHEVGLDISHAQYHKHGAYILRNSDIAGFSRDEQRLLAALVRVHRRKFARAEFEDLPKRLRNVAECLAVVLRLAVLLNRGRGGTVNVDASLSRHGGGFRLALPTEWLQAHPLVAADLDEERAYLERAGLALEVRQAEAEDLPVGST